MSKKPMILPALRGSMGDWVYYSCLMPMVELGIRVEYAKEVHPDQALSKLIQRSLEGPRARHIAEYLASTKERFFNSLVLATYGGNPDWIELGNFRSTSDPAIIKLISADDTLGFLKLSGTEKIFAIDGQHRLAGIKQALKKGLDLANEQVPVLLVGHKKTTIGLRRTRRLFTTLNKTAVPVRKRDIISLDEDDVMAIVVRRLVETNDAFRDPKIAVVGSQNIPADNRTCLTTISSLYDLLKLIFMHELKQQSDRKLRFNRPPDARLDHYYGVATAFFSSLGSTFRPVGRLFNSTRPMAVTKKQRGSHGGNLLFRPIGLEIVTKTAIELADTHDITLCDALGRLRHLPLDLASAPYRNVIWDPVHQRIIVGGKRLAHDLVRYIAGCNVDRAELRAEYRNCLAGFADDRRAKLPNRIVP
jgi:DNA sulfur modification protein DndB